MWQIGLVALVAAPAVADEPLEAAPSKETAPQPTAELTEERSSVTRHMLVIDGVEVSYRATAGTLILRQEDGTPKASIFYVSYEREGVTDPGERPVSFAFNGGPGSSSVWLHLGVLGPRRALMDRDGQALPPPYQLVDNPYSLLDMSDLVMIDPVTTGFSRAVPGEDEKKFHGLQGDIEVVGDFIRLWTSRQGRWASPKFLVGESYGTTRAAGLSGYLQDRHGMYLNGLVLVSSVLDFATLRFHVGNDLPYFLILPSYAATAWYHGALESDLQELSLRSLLDEVEAFAMGDYASALLQGRRLDDDEEQVVAARLARYTGLDVDYLVASRLRPPLARFCAELLRERGRTVGRLDSRFLGPMNDGVAAEMDYDPSYAAILGPYTATLNDYLRRELDYESDLPYEILTGRVYPWSFEDFEGRYVFVGERLRSAMTKNRDLKVFVANGYYDLATPYFATEYTFDHLGLDEDLWRNVTMAYYEAGHMMYIHEASLAKMRDDLVAFYAEAVSRGEIDE